MDLRPVHCSRMAGRTYRPAHATGLPCAASSAEQEVTTPEKVPYSLYFRNPNNYIKELLEVGETNMAWDRGILVKRKVDPFKFAELHIGRTMPWKMLLIGDQGTVEYDQDSDKDHPIGVYPTWRAWESQELLEEALENPWGENQEYCLDRSVPNDERPVYKQKHMVIVTEMAPANTYPGKNQWLYLSGLQEEYPEASIYIHGSYSMRFLFGLGIRAGDTDPRTDASKGNIYLTNGKNIATKEAMLKNIEYIRPMGFTVKELEVARNRCMFNIKSFRHASSYWKTDLVMPSVNKKVPVDTETPNSRYMPPSNKSNAGRPSMPAKPGDKVQCDTCSLSTHCKFYRDGSVCNLPEAGMEKLSDFFNTRDSSKIIEGLQAILVRQADRLESAMNTDDLLGEMDPEVGKQADKLFNNGIKYAKLVDPSLTKPIVQVTVGAPASGPALPSSNPREIAMNAMKELQAKGFTAGEITKELLADYLAGRPVHRAIEGEVINGGERDS